MADDSTPMPDFGLSGAFGAGRHPDDISNGPLHLQPDAWNARADIDNPWSSRSWRAHKHSTQSNTPAPDTVKWKIKWTPDCFPAGRVLIIDYLSNASSPSTLTPGKHHVTIESEEFEDISGLERFYADTTRVHAAALRVIHVQNATWATPCLLRKFNIDHPDELVGMPGFSKWARYEKPRQRQGKPFPNGRSWREQTDPWRSVSRMAFGLDYLKTYRAARRGKGGRGRKTVFGEEGTRALMMHLNAWSDSKFPEGYDVCVQRLSVYVQRKLGPPKKVREGGEGRNPYAASTAGAGSATNGQTKRKDSREVDFEDLDNTNTVIIFETSASMLLNDCLIQPRADFEKRWRRLAFFLGKDDVRADHRLAAQCTNMILSDVFHGLAVIWQEFLGVGTDHVNILEDKIYDNPADESRAPELWTNQAAWLKVGKVMWMHQDLIREVQAHMRDVSEVEGEGKNGEGVEVDWVASVPAEYERLAHGVRQDLVQPTASLSQMMYKSVAIRDSRHTLQLGLSMWRLSWITFIFLPLTFISGFFGMNVNVFGGDHLDVGWYFLTASVLMIFVLLLWYCVKHSLQRKRQTPYQRGVYERLFTDLEEQNPQLWTRNGAAEDVEPLGLASKIKWRLLNFWFDPDKTINQKLFANVAVGDDDTDLGAWARFKRVLLRRWLPTIRQRYRPGDEVPMAELTDRGEDDDEDGDGGEGKTKSAPSSLLKYRPETINALAKTTTQVATAAAEPPALQQMATAGLRPMGLLGGKGSRRTSSAPMVGSPRESVGGWRGSEGVMVEERDLGESSEESDGGEGGGVGSEDGAGERAASRAHVGGGGFAEGEGEGRNRSVTSV